MKRIHAALVATALLAPFPAMAEAPLTQPLLGLLRNQVPIPERGARNQVLADYVYEMAPIIVLSAEQRRAGQAPTFPNEQVIPVEGPSPFAACPAKGSIQVISRRTDLRPAGVTVYSLIKGMGVVELGMVGCPHTVRAIFNVGYEKTSWGYALMVSDYTATLIQHKDR